MNLYCKQKCRLN